MVAAHTNVKMILLLMNPRSRLGRVVLLSTALDCTNQVRSAANKVKGQGRDDRTNRDQLTIHPRRLRDDERNPSENEQ